MYCTKCGAIIKKEASFCTKCGQKIKEEGLEKQVDITIPLEKQ